MYGNLIVANDDNGKKYHLRLQESGILSMFRETTSEYFQRNKILCLNASFSHFISYYAYLSQYLAIAKDINTSSYFF